jgi:hypothetical protein
MCLRQSFNDYFTVNHGRLLALWRTVVAYRRQFADMKAATERDVLSMRNDVGRLSRSMHSACLNLNANLQNADLQNQVCALIVPIALIQREQFVDESKACHNRHVISAEVAQENPNSFRI